RVPAGGGRVARDTRVGGVVADRDVVVVPGAAGRVGPDGIQGRVDQAEAAAVDLVGDGDQSGPLRAGQRRAADVVPAGAARRRAADQSALPVGRKGDVDQRTGTGTGLQADVGYPAHRPDRRATRGQRVLVGGLAE